MFDNLGTYASHSVTKKCVRALFRCGFVIPYRYSKSNLSGTYCFKVSCLGVIPRTCRDGHLQVGG